ncbi:MAG: Calx-beta domain-containing protein [Planctomycetaceae bacterium]
MVVTEKLEDRTLMSVTNPIDAVNDFDNNPADENNFPAGADIYVIENLTVNAQNKAGVNLDLDGLNGGLGSLNAVIIRNLTITNNTGLAGVNVVLSNMTGANALDNLIIENLTITGNSGPGLNIYLDNVILNGLTIRSATISNNTAGGISILGVNGSLISNVTINGNTISSNTGGDGILYQMNNASLTNGLAITNNSAINSNAGRGVAFVLDNGSHVAGLLLDTNTIQSNTVGSGVLFDQDNSNVAGSIKNNTISNHAAGYGVEFTPTSSTGNANIDLAEFTKNTITGNGLGGVKVNVPDSTTSNPVSTTFDARIEDNDINNNLGIGIDLTVIDTNDAVDLVIGGPTAAQGNRINGNRGAGIAINLNDTRGNTTGPDRTAATVKILNNTINNTVNLASSTIYNGEGIKFRLFGTNVLTNGTARLFDTIVDKNTINASASHAIDIDASEDSTIEGMLIGNTTGASFGNNNDGNIITNSLGNGNGVNLLRRDRAVIDNFRIIDNTITGNNIGVNLLTRNSYDVSDTLIQDNVISSNRSVGVSMRTEDDSVQKVDIVGNTLSSNASDAIQTSAAVNSGNDQRYLTGSWYKNTITGNGGNGINITSSTVFISPVVNDFITLGRDGIDSVDGRDLGNTITGNSGWGITLNGVGATDIRGSDIKSNGSGGIDINSNVIKADIYNNEISLNTGKGIDIDSTSGVMEVNLVSNIVTFNTGDGLEVLNSGSGVLTLRAIRNTFDLNEHRGIDILNAGGGTAHLTFGDGTFANHNNIRSNGREGVYVINSADTAQSQDSTSTALSAGGSLDASPDLVFELDFNEIKQNGLNSSFSATGLILHVGTSNAGDNNSFDDAPDTTGEASPNSSAGDVGVGTNAVLDGNGRVNARIVNNQFDGNSGDDVAIDSFRSTIQVPLSGGFWGVDGSASLSFDQGANYARDPLARLNLVFKGNTGDSLDVNRSGASYSSDEPMLKSRTNNKIEPDPDGPFSSSTRDRNAQRVGDASLSPNHYVPVKGGGILDSTGPDADGNPQPITLQTSAPHGLATGDIITIRGVAGVTTANGSFRVVVVDATHVNIVHALTGAAITASAGYTGGGEWTSSMFGFSPDYSGSTTQEFYYDGVGPSTFHAETDGTNFFSNGDDFTDFFNSGEYDWANVGAGTIDTESLTINDIVVSEAAGTATFTVTLSDVATHDVVFLYSTLSQSATAFQGAPLAVENATNTTNDIIINSSNHGLVTGDLIVVSGVAGNTAANNTVANPTHEVIVINLNRFILKGIKGNGAYTGGGTWVPVHNGDYSTTASLGFITSGNTTTTITVPINNDSVDEGDEKFFVLLRTQSNANIVDQLGIATITDNDATPTLSIGDVTQNEGTGGQTAFNFTVTLSAASEKTVTVDFATSDGTALEPGDYRSQFGTLTFAPGETTKTVTVMVEADDIDELDETFNVTLSNAVNAGITDAAGLGTITDDDVQVTPQISINDRLTIAEGNIGSHTEVFILSLDQASTVPVSVTVTTANGVVFDQSALAGQDYQATTQTVTFAPGQTTQAVQVTILADTLDEFNESFFLNLTSPVNATIADAQGQGTIIDDDATVATLSINNVSNTEGNSGFQNYVFTVTLSTASGKTVTVDFATADGAVVDGSATEATDDYDANNGTVTFNPGETTKTITIKVNGDNVYEFDEEFYVNLTNAVNTAGITDAQGVGTILDNEAPPTISISSPSSLEGSDPLNPNEMVFTVTLSHPSERPVSVDYETEEGEVTSGGSAITAVDVFLVLDDTASFVGVGPGLIAAFPQIVADLQASLPGYSLGFGIGRTEEYNAFSTSTSRAFILNQPVLVSSDPEFDNAINSALGRAAPGTGGGHPEAWLEALYQVATGAGFDGNDGGLGDTTDSGNAGLVSTQINPGASGDIPAFSTFTADPSGPVVAPSGNIGGVGYRPGALHLVLLATDTGTGYEPDAQATYIGLDGVTVDATDITNGGRNQSPNGVGASIQETIDALVANGVQVIGLGTNSSTLSQPRQGLEAFAKLTGSVNKTSAPIDGGIAGDPIDPGDPLYFQISTSSSASIAAAIVAAVTGSIGNTGAAAGLDFTDIDGTLNFTKGHLFGAGTTTLEIHIPIEPDIIDENDETFTVTLVNPVNGTLDANATVGTGTIIDDDGEPSISIDDITVLEGGVAEFTVSLSLESGKQISVQFETEDGSAVSPGDFSFTSGLVVFEPGETSKTIQINVNADGVDEFDEDFFIRLQGAINASIADDLGEAIITDIDAAPVASIDSVSIVEGDSGSQDMVFTVTLSGPSEKGVQIDYQTSANTAIADVDYTESNGTLTFTPGNVSGAGTTVLTISIPIIGDNVYEFDDTFNVTLLNPVNVTIDPIAGEGVGTILDNEAPPTISIDSPSSLEGSDPLNPNEMVFTVTLSHPSERPVSVDYDTEEGDVTSGGSTVTAVDIFLLLDDTGSFTGVGPSLIAGFPGIVTALEAALPGFSLAFGIGRFEDYGGADLPFILNQPIVVSTDPQFDAAINGALGRSAPGFGGDGPESAIEALFQIATGAGYDGNDDGDTTDNGAAGLVTTQTTPGTDVPAFSTYTLDPTGPTILPSGNIGGVGYRPGALHLVLLATDIGFAYQPDGLLNYTGSGFTVPAVNITSGGRGTTPFGTGASIQATIDALIANGIEVIGLGTNAAAGSQPRRGLEGLALLTGSINETSAPIDSGIVGDPINPGEAMYFQINASAPDNIADAIVAAVAGSVGNIGAAAGLDFTEDDNTLNFTPGFLPGAGTTVLEIRIPIVPDLIDENDENFTVTLLNPVNGTLDSNATVGTATIIDDDDPPEISIDDINVLEGGVAEFTVSLNIESGKQVTVQFVTEDGSALVPNDYQSNSGLVIFAPGETTKTVSVNINTDGLDEFEENFFVRLQNPTDGTILDDIGEGTILDIDPHAQVSIGDFTVVREGDTGTKTATFLVTLDTPSAKPISVDYETANNTAVSGLDYETKTGTVTFAPGETSKLVTVTTLTDILSEYDEIFHVNLLNPVNADIDDGQGTAVITDDDPLVTLRINDVSISEGNVGDTVFTFTVSLSRDSGRTITVDYATQNGSATANGDYDAKTGSLTFNPGETTKTIDVVVHGDLKHEANETFFVKLTNLVDANFSDDLGQAIIANDDAIPSITINDVTLTEGNAGFLNFDFTVTLSNPSGQNVTVDYFTVDFPPLNGTAKPGLDYTPAVGTLTFAEGETTKTITVQVVGDLKNEFTENFFVQLSNVQNATLADARGEGTIIDNDTVPSLTITDKRVAERDGGTRPGVFEVRLSAASGKTVTVDFATMQTGDAVSGVDYLPINGTLTFLEGETVKEVIVPVVGDLFNEFDETYTVHLSNAVNASIADADGLGTIVDNDPVPTAKINDVTVAPNAGNAVLQATFTVTLSQASGKPITVDYQTQNGSATAGSDYTAKTGTLTFNPGVSTQTVTIAVAGLTFNEFDENFFVNLFNSVNAGILDNQGIGTIQGDTLQINGTNGNDVFNLQLAPPPAAPGGVSAASTNHSLTINGVAQNIPANRYRFLNLNGLAGNDTLLLNGTTASETAVLEPGGIQFKSPSLNVNGSSFSTIDVTGGGGNDTADLKDSAGDDVFTGTPTLASLVGAGFTNTVRGFSLAQGLAYAGGFDIANLLDSTGNDRFLGRDVRSQMTGTGFYNSASRFEQVNAFADMGGFDIASLYGSPGDDVLVSRPDRTSLKGPGFENIANRFDNVTAYATPGGNDTATIFDSAGNDRYVGTANNGAMSGFVSIGGPAYLNQAIDFKVLEVIASTGHDEADMKNIRAVDTVFGQGSEFTLTRSVQKDKLTGFDVITGRAAAGQTVTADLNAIDYAFVTEGAWNFI